VIDWLGEMIVSWAVEHALSGRSTIGLLRAAGQAFTDAEFWPLFRQVAGYQKGFSVLRGLDPSSQIPGSAIAKTAWRTRNRFKVDLRYTEYNRKTGTSRTVERSLSTDVLSTPANMATDLANKMGKEYGAEEAELEWEFQNITAIREGISLEEYY